MAIVKTNGSIESVAGVVNGALLDQIISEACCNPREKGPSFEGKGADVGGIGPTECMEAAKISSRYSNDYKQQYFQPNERRK